jgi:hypothetical protein
MIGRVRDFKGFELAQATIEESPWKKVCVLLLLLM